MPYLYIFNLHKHNKKFNCLRHYTDYSPNKLLSKVKNLKQYQYSIKAQKEATLQMLHGTEMDSKWVAAWGKWPFTSSIQITFLKHVVEALAHAYHTHNFTFANQMS